MNATFCLLETTFEITRRTVNSSDRLNWAWLQPTIKFSMKMVFLWWQRQWWNVDSFDLFQMVGSLTMILIWVNAREKDWLRSLVCSGVVRWVNRLLFQEWKSRTSTEGILKIKMVSLLTLTTLTICVKGKVKAELCNFYTLINLFLNFCVDRTAVCEVIWCVLLVLLVEIQPLQSL